MKGVWCAGVGGGESLIKTGISLDTWQSCRAALRAPCHAGTARLAHEHLTAARILADAAAPAARRRKIWNEAPSVCLSFALHDIQTARLSCAVPLVAPGYCSLRPLASAAAAAAISLAASAKFFFCEDENGRILKKKEERRRESLPLFAVLQRAPARLSASW